MNHATLLRIDSIVTHGNYLLTITSMLLRLHTMIDDDDAPLGMSCRFVRTRVKMNRSDPKLKQLLRDSFVLWQVEISFPKLACCGILWHDRACHCYLLRLTITQRQRVIIVSYIMLKKRQHILVCLIRVPNRMYHSLLHYRSILPLPKSS
jgi:hypothetical protein